MHYRCDLRNLEAGIPETAVRAPLSEIDAGEVVGLTVFRRLVHGM